MAWEIYRGHEIRADLVQPFGRPPEANFSVVRQSDHTTIAAGQSPSGPRTIAGKLEELRALVCAEGKSDKPKSTRKGQP